MLTLYKLIFFNNKAKKWNYKIEKKNQINQKKSHSSGGIWTLAACMEGNQANQYTTRHMLCVSAEDKLLRDTIEKKL